MSDMTVSMLSMVIFYYNIGYLAKKSNHHCDTYITFLYKSNILYKCSNFIDVEQIGKNLE